MASWGELRRLRLEREIERQVVLQPDDATITICAELRQRCNRTGHALGAKIHDGDRWIAAIAIQLDVPASWIRLYSLT